MNCIDLHIHTTASDGTDSPRAAVEKAASLGLAAVSIQYPRNAPGCLHGILSIRAPQLTD